MEPVTVIGAGLAGSECAWQLARRGIPVTLREMKPEKMTPAHVTPWFAELCCSNSLRGAGLENAVGLLKEELRRLDSLILRCADATAVPAGGALAVDREGFARMVTEELRNHPLITVVPGEVTELPEGQVVVASGPLTSDALAEHLLPLLGDGQQTTLNFFDAAAPLVSFDSVDMDSAYFASRYDKGTPDYINCPLSKEEYLSFWQELTTAQEAEVHGFEDGQVFEGCMPVEVMARRGEDTLRFGPLKPRGLPDPKTGKEPYAVVQLRRDNADGSIYNLVGFQTHLRWPEQKRVFTMIPALKDAQFLRYGVMHRNTYLDSPRLLDRYYRLKSGSPYRFCRTDDRRRGLCGVLRQRLSGGSGDGPPPEGTGSHRLPAGNGHRRSGVVCQQSDRGGIPAHEHQLRHHPAAGPPGQGQAQQECRAEPALAGHHRSPEGGDPVMKLIIDAMGGDNAPLEIVKGALSGQKRWGVDVTLTGDTTAILQALEACGEKTLPQGMEIVHTTETVEMCDDPATVFRRKKDTSMGVGLTMLRDGRADAMVSAGSTGALLTGATLIVKRIRGIRRAAMAPVIPTTTGQAVLIDCGANAECTPEYLVQFAYLGSYYAHRVLGVERPRVGLLNIGAEDSKGTDLQKETLRWLREAHTAGHLNFIGNIEAKEAIKGGCDVIVCDGFSGNVLLKTMEGVGSFAGSTLKAMFKKNLLTKLAALCVMPGLNAFKAKLDPNKVGGTAFIGISRPVIKAHGSSNAEAIENAMGQAVQVARSGIIRDIEENVALMKVERE